MWVKKIINIFGEIKRMFKINRLSAAVIASIATSSVSLPVLAQDDAPIIEEVLVTGMRASVKAAMDIKRDSSGVVDAISAEDIGKFPDTNLAESLQRITGVSIERSNGEGSRITVRGWGPDFNMVTLNGRTLPTGSAYGGGSGADASTRGGSSRAFDFANLASEAVSGVEVYKTGKANITTGGIGATVNILTAKPLDNPGFTASVGSKAVADSTNRTGDDLTPELSGIVSWTDDAEKFGVGLSASYQERDSGYTGATVNGWSVDYWPSNETDNTIYDRPASASIFENAPQADQLYARPNDIRYAFSDTERTRTNAQLTLQFAPTESFIASLDYTFAEKDVSEHRGEVTNWVQNGQNLAYVEFDSSEIATPIIITEDYSPGVKDVGLSQQYRGQTDTLDSLGINLEWAVTDTFTLALDAHDSTMESVPTGPGYAGELDVGLGAPIKTGKTLYFGGDLPYWNWTLDDSIQGEASANGEFDEGDISSTVMRIFSAEQTSDVTQVKLDGMFEFDQGRFDFGIERREMSSNTTNFNGTNNQVLGGWGADNPGEFPEGLITPFNVTAEFEDFSTGTAPAAGFKADARALAAFLDDAYDSAYVGVENTEGDGVRNTRGSDTIEEDTTAAYFQLGVDSQLGDFEVNILTGVRYETTDQTSISNTPPVSSFVWQSDNDFQSVFPAGVDATISKNDYDAFLPNLDVSVSFTDNIIGRFSFSKTLARVGLGNLTSSVNGFGVGGSTLLSAIPTANANNPYLKPLESTNFDVSFEWYFDETSYASVGFFEKRVENFVGNRQVDRTFGILDQTGGPRAQEAYEALEDLGYEVDVGRLYTMMVILANPDDFPNGAADFDDTLAQQDALGEDCQEECDIVPVAGDPEMVFQVTSPVNDDEIRKVNGLELAAQHFFGDSGFGLMANYTIVRGDIKFDDLADPTQDQFALLGLSDTANLVFMYENYGVQARFAYNWRDEYLSRQNIGGSKNPGYTEAHSQIDLNVSYDITDELTVSFEGINITGEDRREHARNEKMLWGLEDLGARCQLGIRYNL